MSTILTVSVRLYAAALPLYPPDLRRDFGAEMADAFAQDLADALQRNGMRGVMRVWYCAISELLRIALPSQAEKPVVAVPCISFALCETVMSGQLMLAFRHDSAIFANGPVHPGLIPFLLIWPSLLASLTALAALWAGDRGLPLQLKLSAN
jgi:hypothetical protein